MKVVQTNEAEGAPGLERPGADVIALPQLERLPTETEETPGGLRLDSRSSRLEALELVRAAVELADRIERDAQDTAKDRLARIEEEVRLRRTSLDDRETELEHERRDLDLLRQEHERKREELEAKQRELEEYRRQVIEAAETLQARAEQETAELLAHARSEAQALLEQGRSDAAQLAEAARSEAAKLTESARMQAAEVASAAQTEAEQTVQAAAAEAERLAEAARAETERSAPEQSETEQLPEEHRPPAEPEVGISAGDGGPDAEPTAAGENEGRGFTPPPVSVEDLATSSLPRLGILNRLRDR